MSALPRSRGPVAGHVLVVDRDPDTLTTFAMLLEAAGFTVRTATGPEAALSALGEFRPTAVVVGMRPTDPDGFHLLARVAGLPADRRPLIAVLAGWVDERVRGELAAAGAGYVTHKADDPAGLLAVLRGAASLARAG